MPQLKRCTLEKEAMSCGSHAVESCTAAVSSKKMKKISGGLFTDPVNQIEGCNFDFSKYWSTREGSFYDQETKSVSQKVVKNKLPLLKSSRGRPLALPMKLRDSVLLSRKKEKSDCCDDLDDGLADSSKHNDDIICHKKLKRGEFYDDVYLVKKQRIENYTIDRLQNVILEHYSSSRSSVTSVNEGSLSPAEESGGALNECLSASKSVEKKVEEKADFYEPGDFVMGDIVWAKCGKNFPAWPAIVIDPLWQAPEGVLRACVPGTLCVMFYGYSRTGRRDYAWVKAGMVFPFHEYMDRFQGQTKLYGSKPHDYQLAIEEAILAENGYAQSAVGSGEEVLPVADEAEETTASNQESECCPIQQDTYDKRKDTQTCDSCRLTFPCRMVKKIKNTTAEAHFVCEHCIKLRKSKQFCGICKKIGHHSDGGSWVCCDSCDVWVHAECANISSKLLKDLETSDYYCPECIAKPSSKALSLDKLQLCVRSAEKIARNMPPNRLAVVCNGVGGIYYPNLHFEWERHTGCRAKKWKHSVKVKGSNLTLEKWVYKCEVFGSWQLPVFGLEHFDLNGGGDDLYLTWDHTVCKSCEETDPRQDTAYGASPIFMPSVVVMGIVFTICLLFFTKCRGSRDEINAADLQPETATAATAPPHQEGLGDSKINACTALVVINESKKNSGPDSSSCICPICLEGYHFQDIVRSIDKCEHCFHADCIELWLRKNITCPVCRTTLSDVE